MERMLLNLRVEKVVFQRFLKYQRRKHVLKVGIYFKKTLLFKKMFKKLKLLKLSKTNENGGKYTI